MPSLEGRAQYLGLDAVRAACLVDGGGVSLPMGFEPREAERHQHPLF